MYYYEVSMLRTCWNCCWY